MKVSLPLHWNISNLSGGVPTEQWGKEEGMSLIPVTGQPELLLSLLSFDVTQQLQRLTETLTGGVYHLNSSATNERTEDLVNP